MAIAMCCKGGFGIVNAVIQRSNKKWFAMKSLNKVKVIETNNVSMVFNERDLLTQLESPWIVNLHYAFHDEAHCYLVMDLALGKLEKEFINEVDVYYFSKYCVKIPLTLKMDF